MDSIKKEKFYGSSATNNLSASCVSFYNRTIMQLQLKERAEYRTAEYVTLARARISSICYYCLQQALRQELYYAYIVNHTGNASD
jgi:hypothetical protein